MSYIIYWIPIDNNYAAIFFLKDIYLHQVHPLFNPTFNVIYNVKGNSFNVYNAYNQVCSCNIDDKNVIIYLIIQLSSMYVYSSWINIQHSMSDYIYIKTRYIYQLGL